MPRSRAAASGLQLHFRTRKVRCESSRVSGQHILENVADARELVFSRANYPGRRQGFLLKPE
jgi:hypothetical protein